MKIHKLQLTNFLPYYGVNFIDFPQDENANTLIFFGENTKGKTSILNAIRWVFYGKAYDKYGNRLTYSDLINKQARAESEKAASVEIVFEANNSTFVLSRHMDGTNDLDQSGIVTMKVNNSVLTSEEAERIIEKISPESTSRFFLFDGELLREYQELMDSSSHSSKKIKSSIEDVMGFPTLDDGLSILESITRKLASKTAKERSINQSLQALQKEREETKADLDSKVAEKRELEESDKNSSIRHSELAERVEKNKSLKEVLQEREQLKQNRREADLNRNDILENLNEKKRDLWRTILVNYIENKVTPAIEKKEKHEEISRKLAEKKALFDLLENIKVNHICPTCDQSKPFSIDMQKKSEGIYSEMEALSQELVGFEGQDDLNSWISVGQMFNDATRIKDFYALEKRYANAEKKYQELVRKINTAEENLEGTDVTLDSLDQDYREMIRLEQVIEDNKNTLSTIQQTIESLRSAYTKKSEAIAQNSVGNAAIVERAYVIVQKLSTLFSLAKDKLRSEIAREVEAAAKDAFQKMISRPDDFSGLQITDSYGLNILANDGSIVPQRSAGAEQVVALALICGLNKVGNSAGPVIMDTPFGRLDEIHRENIINHLSETSKQFVLFVHSGELKRGSPMLHKIKSRIGKTYDIRSNGPWISELEEID